MEYHLKCFRIWGVGFRIWGLRFKGVGFSGLGVQGFGFRPEGLFFWVSFFASKHRSGSGVQALLLSLPLTPFEGFGFRILGSSFAYVSG